MRYLIDAIVHDLNLLSKEEFQDLKMFWIHKSCKKNIWILCHHGMSQDSMLLSFRVIRSYLLFPFQLLSRKIGHHGKFQIHTKFHMNFWQFSNWFVANTDLQNNPWISLNIHHLKYQIVYVMYSSITKSNYRWILWMVH